MPNHQQQVIHGVMQNKLINDIISIQMSQEGSLFFMNQSCLLLQGQVEKGEKSRASAVMLLPLAVINCLWWWDVQGQASHLLNGRTNRMSSLLPQQYLPGFFKACRPAKTNKQTTNTIVLKYLVFLLKSKQDIAQCAKCLQMGVHQEQLSWSRRCSQGWILSKCGAKALGILRSTQAWYTGLCPTA